MMRKQLRHNRRCPRCGDTIVCMPLSSVWYEVRCNSNTAWRRCPCAVGHTCASAWVAYMQKCEDSERRSETCG